MPTRATKAAVSRKAVGRTDMDGSGVEEPSVELVAQAIVACGAEGKLRAQDVADRTGLSHRHAALLMSKPEVAARVLFLQRGSIRAMASLAIAALGELLITGSPAVRLAAARDILDRAGVKAPSTNGLNEGVSGFALTLNIGGNSAGYEGDMKVIGAGETDESANSSRKNRSVGGVSGGEVTLENLVGVSQPDAQVSGLDPFFGSAVERLVTQAAAVPGVEDFDLGVWDAKDRVCPWGSEDS